MSELRSKTGQALAWDLFGNYGGQIISFAISIFLARLLEPEEFGLVGMSMVFIAVLRIFMDMGFASALIQAKNTTSLTYSSIFYLNVFVGLLLTLGVYFVAPFVGEFYEQPIVTNIVRLLSVVFLISSFNVVQSTLLRKELNFRVLTLRGLISQSLAGIVAVFFAWKGFGVYALIIQQIVAAIISTILLWKVTEWYPKLEFSFLEVRSLSSFSLYVLASQSVGQLIKQADTLVIGKLFSAATLGFYSRANSLNDLISRNSVSSIAKVFFPTLANIQDENERFIKVYLKTIEIVAGIAILLTGIFFLAGEELIIGLFGKKWGPSVLIFEILIIKGFTYPISSMIVNVFMAKGKSKENFHYGNIRKVLRLSTFGIAYFYGFYPFVYSQVAVSLLAWVLNNWFVSRTLNISFKSQMKAVVPYLLWGGIIVLVLQLLFLDEFNYLMAGVQVILFTLLYYFGLRFTKSVLTEEIEFYFKKIRKRIKR